jgi:Inner membrane protein YgaP-like, transmembrane domain
MKGNKVVCKMSAMILIALALTHFAGQMNLLAPTWLWLAAFVGFMAFQATFTGFCRTCKILGGSKTSSVCSYG